MTAPERGVVRHADPESPQPVVSKEFVRLAREAGGADDPFNESQLIVNGSGRPGLCLEANVDHSRR